MSAIHQAKKFREFGINENLAERNDRLLRFAEPHRDQIGVSLLDQLEVEPLGEMARIG